MENQNGVYGTPGVAAPTNIPGARSGALAWVDSFGSFWLFGGEGYAAQSNSGHLNDLWKWNGTQWIWISGSKFRDQLGEYGVKGSASVFNLPGGRKSANGFMDDSGRLWLFGGYGSDSTWLSLGRMNDLWRFSP